MKTKLGQTIPAELASTIQQDKQVLTMWDRLRPSCQRSYVKYFDKAKKPETRVRRVEQILKMTADYYQRHQKTAGK